MFRDDKTFAQPEKVQTEADIWNKDRFIAWLERKPAGDQYEWENPGRCLLFKYLAESGMRPINAGQCSWRSEGGDVHHLPVDYAEAAAIRPHTFGAALERARKLL